MHTPSKYQIIEEIGSGAYGKVYKAIRKSDGETIALKVLDNVDSDTVKDIMNEIRQLESIKPGCENMFVVCYYDDYHDFERRIYYIEMEYVEGVTLREFMKRLKSTSDYETYNYYLLAIIRDIAKGLEYIHNLKIVHNDIKPDNIMIQPDYIPKIIDFGAACKYLDPSGGVNFCFNNTSTPYYTPPEVIEYNKGKKMRRAPNDMWSLGVTLFDMAVGQKPFLGADRKTLYHAIITETPDTVLISNQVLRILAEGLLDKNPGRRYTADMVVDIIERHISSYKPKNPSLPPTLK